MTNYASGGVPVPVNPGGTDPQQHFAVGEAITGEWWTLFHSPRLDAVLHEAVGNSPSVAAARANLARAREIIVEARSGLYPQVDFAATAARERTSLLQQGVNQLGPISNELQIGPSVTYTLDLFGANRRRIEQQQALAEYQKYLLDGVYLALTGNAVRHAVEIASARAQMDEVQLLLHEDEQTLGLVHRLFDLHYKTRADLESARSQLASDRALLPPLRQQLSIARDTLAVLLAKSPGDEGLPDFDLTEFALPQDLPVAIPSELVRRRPDVLEAEAQLHAASAAIGIATAQLYPSLTLTGSLTQASLSTTTLFTESAIDWVFGAGLTAPLFRGGALEAQRRGAIDTFDAAYASYRQTVFQSFGQVADVLQALEHDAELLEAQQESIDAAQAALDAARATYSLNRAQILQVLDAQRQLGRARLGHIRARAQRYLDTVDLFGAMGGGWQDWKGDKQALGGIGFASAGATQHPQHPVEAFAGDRHIVQYSAVELVF